MLSASRLLASLLSQPGIGQPSILVCVDSLESAETFQLLDLLQIPFLVHSPEGGSGTARISRYGHRK